MNRSETSTWKFIVLPAAAMSLGWGLRGQVGHSTGAMIPGAFVALVLCSLLRGKQFSRGMAIGFGAIAFGYGATITTQDTAQLADGQLHKLGTSLAMAFTGLAIKGAVWAVFGGILLGLTFVASRYRWRDIVLGMVFLVAAFPVGWIWINQPRPVYFSVTRHETYGGYVLGGIVLLAWLTFRGRTKIPLVLGICAAIDGGVGFPLGVFLNSLGLHSAYVGGWHDWWKIAETTYGACMGIGLGIGTYMVRDKLPDAEGLPAPAAGVVSRTWGTVLGLAICEIFTLLAHHRLGGYWIGGWLILGSVMVCLVAYFPRVVGWQIGITLTFYVTAVNLITYWHHEQKIGNAAFLWAAVWLATLAFAWSVPNWWDEKNTAVFKPFVSLMWAIVALTALKTFIDRAVLYPQAHALAAAGGRWTYTVRTWAPGLGDEVILTTMAIVMTWLMTRTDTRQEPLLHSAALPLTAVRRDA